MKDIYAVEQPGRMSAPKTRTKPGKKRRIQLRKKSAAAETAKQTDAEKRNRKNREKKIKRRQKAREMKAAATGQSLDSMENGSDVHDETSVHDES